MGTAVCEMLGRGFGIAFADCLTSLRLVGRSTASAWKFQNNCLCTTVCARRGSDRDRPTKRRPCFPLARSIELTTATDGISLNILRWTVIRRSLHKVFVVEFPIRFRCDERKIGHAGLQTIVDFLDIAQLKQQDDFPRLARKSTVATLERPLSHAISCWNLDPSSSARVKWRGTRSQRLIANSQGAA